MASLCSQLVISHLHTFLMMEMIVFLPPPPRKKSFLGGKYTSLLLYTKEERREDPKSEVASHLPDITGKSQALACWNSHSELWKMLVKLW